MKKKVIVIVAMLLATTAMAQNYGQIAINVVVPQMPNIPEEARTALETKMQQVATQYGLASNGLTDRFVMTAKVNVTSKDVTPTTPVKISQKMEVTLFIGDVIDNKLYESVVLNVAGIGQSETQSMIKAFNQIKTSNPQLKVFVEKAERKIVEYYSNNCQFILAEANTLAQQQRYDAAIAKLMAVPKVCKECYEQSMTEAVEVYQKKIDENGALLVQQARNKWLVTRDYSAAKESLAILATIAPQSKAQNDAKRLIGEINTHLRNLESMAEEQRKQEWEFALKQYNDHIKTQHKLIDAARDIGLAYANNQPRTITYNNFISW